MATRRCPPSLPAVLRVLTLSLLALSLRAMPGAAQTDVIRGRVIGIDGQPLVGVKVTATSLPGQVTREATTNPQGNYQIAFPGGSGDYILGFIIFGYAFRQYEVRRLADEAVLIANARLSPIQLDSLVVASAIQQRVARGSTTPEVGGVEQINAAEAVGLDQLGNLMALAASLPGVLLLPGIDGEADAFSVLGLGGDQNSVTVNGIEGNTSLLPRDAAVSTSLTTSPYDVSSGGFSGGNVNINSRAGSNLKSRGTSLLLTAPQVQWTDRAAAALGTSYTNFSLSGMASGPLTRNKSFYNVAYELGRQSRPNRTLLSTNQLGLQAAGVATDSVTQLMNILRDQLIPASGPGRANRVADRGSLFGAFDFSPPTSTSGQSIGITVNGQWQRQSPVGASELAFESAAGDRTSWAGGLQVRNSGYLGMLLSETRLGLNLSRNFGEPYLALPAGRVRVTSEFEDRASGVQMLTFGGNQNLGTSTRNTNVSLQSSLSWFDDANRHRLKLTGEFGYRASTQQQAANLLGSFTFNSLEDLAAGRPAWFTRTLSARERNTGVMSGSLSLGDSYRHTPDLQLQYGLRLDAAGYTTQPARNALVEATFGQRNDRVPAPLVITPRIGFSWTYGRASQIAGFAGAATGPRAVIRGGIGVYSNSASTSQLASAIDNTGLPSGVQQINCVGPAAPSPDWFLYAADPGAIPDRCSDGSTGTAFASAAPNVTLFSRDFAPTRSIRSNLAWAGGFLDNRFNLSVDGTYSVNLNQQRSVDLNFLDEQRFELGDDGRPVFVTPADIVPGTGNVAAQAARRSTDFARVNQVRSDLESRTAQLSLRVSPILRAPTSFSWNAAYTYTHVREQVSGFSSTAGNPLDVDWARSGLGPHSFNYTLRYRFFNAVQVSWSGQFRSGSAYTPNVAGDINGDGYGYNDRAFIPDPATTADAGLADGMRNLLANSPRTTRQCLERQLARIARRNSCRGPWTSSASINVALDAVKFRLPHRTAVSFSLSNPLGAADLLVNGSGNLRGWGQSVYPDASLLYVRGFDATTRQFRYEVNQRFGAVRPQLMTLRSPAVLTMQMRIDLGPTRERQNLSTYLSSGRTTPGTRYSESMFRSAGSSGVTNPMVTILRSQDSLHLTVMQADSIARMNRRYLYQVDSLWTVVGRRLAALPDQYDEGAAYQDLMEARYAQFDLLLRLGPAVRQLLTPAQLRKLPALVTNMLDPRYLTYTRNGSRLYLAGAGLAPIGGAVLLSGISSVMTASGTYETIRYSP